MQETTTLLEALAKRFPDSSKNTLRSLLASDRVTVDGRVAKRGSQEVIDGQVQILPRKSFADCNLKILWSDEQIIVVDKPVGLLSVDDEKRINPSVHAILKKRFSTRRIFPVHRLDRDTSGVLVFACGEEAKELMKEQFATHSTKRVYYAVVQGHLEKSKGTIKSYLNEDINFFVRSGKTGKLAITHYEVLKTTRKLSYLQVELETGRKNQIRVHLSEMGHPVVGDRKYGSICNPLKRMGLHAHHLTFYHPGKQKDISFTSPIPWSNL